MNTNTWKLPKVIRRAAGLLILSALCLALLIFHARADFFYIFSTYSSTDFPALGEIVDISIYGIYLSNVDTLDLSFTYDASVLELVSYDPGMEGDAGWTVTDTSASWRGEEGGLNDPNTSYSEYDLLLTLHFQVRSDAAIGATAFSFKVTDIGGPDNFLNYNQVVNLYHETLTLDIQAEHSEIIGRGEDDGFTWTLDENGNVVFSGEGAIKYHPYYSSGSELQYHSGSGPASWREGIRYRNVTTLTIEEGITSIEAYALKGFPDVASISLPDSLEEIGTGIATTALYTVNYAGTMEDWEQIEVGPANVWLALSSITAADGPVYEYLSDIPIGQSAGSGGTVSTAYANGLVVVSPAEEAPSYSEIDELYTGVRYQYYIFQSGITHLDAEMMGMSRPKWIYLPDTVTGVDADFFDNCWSQQEEDGPLQIYLEQIYFGGTEEEWNDLMAGNESWEQIRDSVDAVFGSEAPSWQGSGGATVEGVIPAGAVFSVRTEELTEEDVAQLDEYMRYLAYSLEMEENGSTVDAFENEVTVTVQLPEDFADGYAVEVYQLDSSGTLTQVSSSLSNKVTVYDPSGSTSFDYLNGIVEFTADQSGIYLVVTANVFNGELVSRVPESEQAEEETAEEPQEELPAEEDAAEESGEEAASSGGSAPMVMAVLCVVLFVVLAGVVIAVVKVCQTKKNKKRNGS